MNAKERRARTKTDAADFRALKKAAGAGEPPELCLEDVEWTYGPPVTEISDTELAALAWQINPGLCKKNLVAAIQLTIKTLFNVRKAKTEAFKELIVESLK